MLDDNNVEATIQQLLHELAAAEAQKESVTAQMENELEPLRQREAEIRAKYPLDTLDSEIATLQFRIKELTLKHGKTVKGESHQAVYMRGRISWDSKGLSGYAVAHPEILTFRKQGKPSVSIRRLK